MKASAAARLVLARTLDAKVCICFAFALEGTDLDQPAAAGVSVRFGFFSYHRTRLASDFAWLRASRFDVLAKVVSVGRTLVDLSFEASTLIGSVARPASADATCAASTPWRSA